MFTGLIETKGKIIARKVSASGTLTVQPEKKFEDLLYGESIAVNGACMTLEQSTKDGQIIFHVLEETFKRTNLGSIPIGGIVNLERSLAVGDRLGGHMVSGHVDTTSSITSIRKIGDDTELVISLPESISPFIVEKGSVAIDGISLTIVSLTEKEFSVHLIPISMAETNLCTRKVGDIVNLETDLVGKYIQRHLALIEKTKSSVDLDSLKKAGW